MSTAQIDRMQLDALATARCMRAHGVANFPDPSITAGAGGQLSGITFSGSIWDINLESPAYRAAEKVCPTGLGGNLMLADIAARQKYGCRCLGSDADEP